MNYQPPTAADVDENGNEVPGAQPENDDEALPSKPQHMTIKFRDFTGTELQFRLKPTTKLGKAMDHFSTHSQQKRKILRFLFDDRRVLPTDTPTDVSSRASVSDLAAERT